MDIRSCQNCHCFCNEDFKQVANLKASGLMIYIHYNKPKQKRYFSDYSGSNIILHNTSDRDIKRFDYVVELCQYRTKCLRCKMLIQRVRNIIDEISTINKNDVIGVCDFCKRSHQKNKCKRCQYIVEKFVSNKALENENRDVRFKLWLSRLQQILKSFLEAKVICKHNICLDLEYKWKLRRLLNSLNTPVPMRQPEIDAFPGLLNLRESGLDIGENGKFLEDLVSQLKYKEIGNTNDEELSFDSGSERDCICKHFVSNKSDHKSSSSAQIVSQDKVSLRKVSVTKGDENDSTFMTSSKYQQQSDSKPETLAEKSTTGRKSKSTEVSKKTKNRYLTSNKENEPPTKSLTSNDKTKISNKNTKTSKSNVKKSNELNGGEKKDTEKKVTQKGKKLMQNSEYRLMLELLKEREKEKKEQEQLEKTKKKQDLPLIKDLPDLKPLKRLVKAESLEAQISESILECKDNRIDVVTKMIKGTEIVNMDSNYRDAKQEYERLPLLFKIKTDVTDNRPTDDRSPSLPKPDADKKYKKIDKDVPDIDSGVIRYELSNREFIEKGWTILPSTKIMRRINIYKMLPASNKFDWFENNKKQKRLFYNTGEKFAEINDSGGGKWFYKNGNVALDGYSAEGTQYAEYGTMNFLGINDRCIHSNRVKRYVIYSSGEDIVSRKKEPITILACFDYHGNGVVYDCYGNVRIKYNQSEGVVMDKHIAAPSRWKWHTLNDPPVLQQMFLNTYDNSNHDLCIKQSNVSDNIKPRNEEMIAIELDNFVKEKANKLMQKFKPFQIRMKALKINDFFSLRVLDQANIFLLFRCDGMYFKIGIGMLLKSDEIVDTDVAEMSEVSTPFDKFPPKTPSLININNTISNVRKRYSSSKKDK